jgi:hypothetical protein
MSAVVSFTFIERTPAHDALRRQGAEPLFTR